MASLFEDTELTANPLLQGHVESVTGEVPACCRDNILNVERVVYWMTQVDFEDLVIQDVLIFCIETLEELCIEIRVSAEFFLFDKE